MVVGNSNGSKTLEEAIERAIIAHQEWTISKEANRRFGIHTDRPYLTGRVAFNEVQNDIAG